MPKKSKSVSESLKKQRAELVKKGQFLSYDQIKRQNKNDYQRQYRASHPKPVTIGGKKLPESLSNRIKETRDKYIASGQFVSYKDLYDKYKGLEEQLFQKKGNLGELFDIGVFDEALVDELEGSYKCFNVNIKEIKDVVNDNNKIFKADRKNGHIYIKGMGESSFNHYYFSSSLLRIDKEVGFIFKGYELYKERNNTADDVSPLKGIYFKQLVCVSYTDYTIQIDFDEDFDTTIVADEEFLKQCIIDAKEGILSDSKVSRSKWRRK